MPNILVITWLLNAPTSAKRIRPLAVLFICLISSVPHTARASDGWQKVKWASTVGDVRQAYPAAELMSASDQAGMSPKGQTCKLTMPYASDKRMFDVRFCFDTDQHLKSVVLALRPPLESKSLQINLTEKYGQPEEKDSKNSVFSTTRWREGKTIIELISIAGPGPGAMLPASGDVTERGVNYVETYVTLSYNAAESLENKGL